MIFLKKIIDFLDIIDYNVFVIKSKWIIILFFQEEKLWIQT